MHTYMNKKSKKFRVFRFLCFLAYLVCAAVLIIESCMDGSSSANQSNAVGGTIADIFNDISGDQTVAVIPTETNITNKIEHAYVGDTYTINVKVLPEDSTYQSVSYSSSNESVATIADNGYINFLKAGTTTFEVINSYNIDLKDSMTVEVSNVEATKITSSINNATYDSNTGIYTLYKGTQYTISTAFEPDNTTIKNLSYSVDNSYLSVDSYGSITPTKHSFENLSTITVSHGSLTSNIKAKVIDRNIVPLTNIDATSQVIELTEGESKNVSFTFTPTNATFKEYTLSSSNTSIVSAGGSRVTGVKASDTPITITAKSSYYNDVQCTFDVKVNPRPALSSFSAYISGGMVTGPSGEKYYQLQVGDSKNISVSKQPQLAIIHSLTYSSSNSDIATVSSSGRITGVNPGLVDITVIADGMQQVLKLNIIPKPVSGFEDFEIVESSQTNYVQCNTPFNVSSIGINWTPSNTTDKAITYTLNGSTLTSNTITFTNPGHYILGLRHNSSAKYKEVHFYAYYDFSIEYSTQELDLNNLIINDSFEFNIKSNDENQLQTYIVDNVNRDLLSLEEISTNTYKVNVISGGKASISITPVIPSGYVLDNFKKTISINSHHIYTKHLHINAIKDDNEANLIDANNGLSIFKNDNVYLKANIDNNSTIANVVYTSLDETKLSVDNNGKLIPHGIGITEVKIEETYSGLSKIIPIKIYNHIEIDTENSFNITGAKVTYNQTNNSFILMNGFSAKIAVNFTENSTFTNVKYSSSNEKVIQVGNDGTMTPLSVGKSVITMTIDDKMTEAISISINIEVVRQDFITDIHNFLLKVRKGLGHFGAFLVFGICSTFTYLLYFDGKKYFFSVPLNFVQGFAIASLTEYIQTFVPGRCGLFSDVLIDFSGFMIGAVIFTIGIIATHYIRIAIKNKKR